jgi:uncharacterized protein (DUF342 family)
MIQVQPESHPKASMVATTNQKSIDVGSKQLAEYVTDAYKLVLTSHVNDLECRASIEVYDKDNSIPPAELITLLRRNDISTSVDLEQVAEFCSAAASGEELENFLLAQGIPPEHGLDGWFELVVNTGKEEADRSEDESGRVDFKSVQTFSNVEPDQIIGNIYPPSEGRPGHTVTGEVIPAFSGQPCGVIAGSGVRFSEDGAQAIAEQNGRVVFENKVLSIAEEFVVKGNVDLSIGHISFNGFVDIKGDVLDDFDITATKGIRVSGAVGASRINCDGPVTIGTMAGLGRGKIVCKGDFKARYLNQAIVECWGDIQVDNEIRNSIIKATGSIRTAKGLITGGQAVALEGIEAKMLGTRSGTATALTAGVYFPESDRLNFLRSRSKSVANQLKQLGETLAALKRKPLDKLRPALREAFELRIEILTQRQVNLNDERTALTAELEQFVLDEHPTANPKINVLGTIKESVTACLGETHAELPTHISGPVSIIEDTRQGGLRFLSHSELVVNAEEAEQIADS